MDSSSFGYCKLDNSVPIAHLDYTFVGKCNDEKYLEKIVKILRSGTEGHYPDLVKAAEQRLGILNPESKLLLKESPAILTKELGTDDKNNLLSDIESWEKSISEVDKTLQNYSKSSLENDVDLPPVRQTTQMKEDDREVPTKKCDENPNKSTVPRNFSDWDRFDVKEELKKVDDNVKVTKEQKPQLLDHKIKDDVQINKDGLPKAELMSRAMHEKGKGNEAFKESNFEHALSYYNRSLSLFPLTEVFNNRAITNIKLGKFENAIIDCDWVLKLEPSNLKAYLRRGCANQSLENWQQAQMDFQSALQIEPGNKRAKALLQEIKGHITNGGTAMASENGADKPNSLIKGEADGLGLTNNTVNTENKGSREEGSNENKKTFLEESHPTKQRPKGTRLKIVEVDGTEDSNNTVPLPETKTEVSKNTEPGYSEEENIAQSDQDQKNSQQEIRGEMSTKRGKRINIVEVEDESEVTDWHEASDLKNMPSTPKTVDDSYDISKTSEKCCNVPRKENTAAPSSSQETSVKACNESQPSSSFSMGNDKVINTMPAPPIPAGVLRLTNEGNSFLKAGNYASAMDKYSAALATLSEDDNHCLETRGILLSNRAACKLRVGDCKGCIVDSTESVKLKSSPKAYLRRAAANDTLERYEDAYVDYQTTLRLDPKNKSAWDALPRLATFLRNKHGSSWRDKLPKLPSVFPHVFMSPQGTKHNLEKEPQTEKEENLSTSEVEKVATGSAPQKDVEQKLETRSVEKVAKDNFARAKELGNQLVKEGKYREAAERYTECVTYLPGEVVSYTNRALCYLKLDKADKAEEDCGKALEIQPSNVKALFRRAQARKAQNKLREATADLINLTKIEPENKAAKKELDIVKEAWRKELRKIQSQQKPKETETKKSEKILDKKASKEKHSQQKQKSTSKEKSTTSTEQKKASQQSTCGQTGNDTTPDINTLPVRNEDLVLPKVTPFEFWRAWNSIKRKDDLKSYAKILSQIKPSELSNVISNKIDGDFIPVMVSAVRDHFFVDDQLMQGFRLLEELAKVHRFKMALMFLSVEDKTMIRMTIIELERKCLENKRLALSSSAIENLKRNYGIS